MGKLKNAIIVIIPTIITYISFFKNLKFIINMETWRPIIAASVVFIIMIYIVYKQEQKEKLLNAIQANIEKQKLAIEFILTKYKLLDEFNEHYEKLKKSIKENESLAKTLIDK